jgi:hypothetical protein
MIPTATLAHFYIFAVAYPVLVDVGAKVARVNNHRDFVHPFL